MQALWLLAGAAIAVGLLVWLTHFLGFRGAPVLASEKEAAEIAAQAITGGFAPAEIALEMDGRGALLRDKDDRIALVLPHGAHFVARLVGPESTVHWFNTTVSIAASGRSVQLDLGDEAANWQSVLGGRD